MRVEESSDLQFDLQPYCVATHACLKSYIIGIG